MSKPRLLDRQGIDGAPDGGESVTPCCPRCRGLMRWDGDLQANKCVACCRTDTPLIDGATLPPQRPPSGHAGIDWNWKARPIAYHPPTAQDGLWGKHEH